MERAGLRWRGCCTMSSSRTLSLSLSLFLSLSVCLSVCPGVPIGTENGLALGVGSSVVGTTTTGVHEGSLGPSATNSEARKVHSGKSGECTCFSLIGGGNSILPFCMDTHVECGPAEGSLAWAPTFSGSGLRRRPGEHFKGVVLPVWGLHFLCYGNSDRRECAGTSSGSGRRQPLQFEEGIEIYTDSKSREYHEETSLDSIHCENCAAVPPWPSRTCLPPP